jgi:cystathionine beta-lyase/cystathionine gamma-synthase
MASEVNSNNLQKDKAHRDEVDETKYSMDTHLIYGKNITTKWDYSHHVVSPISSSTTFRLDSVERGAQGFISFANTPSMREDESPIYIYDRLGEPNKDILEENLAYIEKGEMAVTFATGMGAISGALGVLTKSGDEILPIVLSMDVQYRFLITGTLAIIFRLPILTLQIPKTSANLLKKIQKSFTLKLLQILTLN